MHTKSLLEFLADLRELLGLEAAEDESGGVRRDGGEERSN